MSQSVQEYRLQVVADYVSEFCVTKLSIVKKYGETGRSYIASDEGLFRALTTSPEIEKALTLRLGERYKEDPSREHLRKYARFQLEQDMGI